jgi:hypothetical protein|tara:strand:- start:17 stop:250 length:234 start_codon:yes stop_codon:yes gene_type:complete
MENLKQYSEDELSLRVFNDETLYNMRFRDSILNILSNVFIFSEEQKENFIQALAEDKKELEEFEENQRKKKRGVSNE